MKNVGIGRIGYLSEPLKIKDVIEKLKNHFSMKTLRLALGNGKSLGKQKLREKNSRLKIIVQ